MKNKAPLVLTVLICAAVVGAGGWLFYHKSGMETEPAVGQRFEVVFIRANP